MSWLAVLIALAPENVLLAGIVVLIGVEIIARRPQGALAISLVAVAAAAAAATFLFGAAKVPHEPVTDLNLREKLILAAIVAAVFAIGLYPDEPLRKTELAAKEFQQRVTSVAIPGGAR